MNPNPHSVTKATSSPPREVDVLVVGAGPAGLAAATAAASHGKSVLVLDDNAAAGGQTWRDGIALPRGTRDRVLLSTRDPIKTRALATFHASGAELLCGRRIVDAPAPGILRALVETASASAQAETYRWKSLILATGARERFLPFPGWTLPGVLGAGGLQALVKGGYPVAAKRVVVAGTGPLLLAVAAHLVDYGAHVLCIAEQASLSTLAPFAASLWSHPGKLLHGLRYRSTLARVPYRTSCWPVAAYGDHALQRVRITDGMRSWDEDCDLLACGFHLAPNTELAALLGCTLVNGFVQVDAEQRTSLPQIYCAGEPTGIAGLQAARLQGEIAGLCAAGQPSRASALFQRRDAQRRFARRLDRAFALRTEVRTLALGNTIVCRCEDVTLGQLENCGSWTEAKLQTRCGMGPCQGRICGPAVQEIFGWQMSSVRPPIFPVPLSFYAPSFACSTTQKMTQEIELQETP